MMWSLLGASAMAALLAFGPPQTQRPPVTPPPPAQQAARDRAPAVPPGTASVSGRVNVMGTAAPIPVRRARVTLQSSALAQPQTTDTDAEGRYRFDGLPTGTYRLKAEKPGYVTLEYGAKRPFVTPAPLQVTDGQAVQADLALPRGAALDGRILTDEGEPAEGITVSAVRMGYTPNGRRPNPVAQTTSDDVGHFRVHSLPPGEYYVQAVPSVQAVAAGRATGLARSYYPGTATVNDAKVVTLALGQESAGLDVVIRRVPVARVTLQVVDSTGKAPLACGWRLVPVGGGTAGTSGFVAPSRPAAIDYPAVPAGQYWVLATARPAPGADVEFGMTQISVAGEDLSGITIRTERGARVEGRLEADGQATLPPAARLRVAPRDVEFEFPSVESPTGPPPVAPVGIGDGRFTIASLFGPKLLRVTGLPAAWALKGVSLGDADITDTVTDFRVASSPASLRVVVTDRTAAVSGTAADERGRPAADARVVIFAEDAGHWGPWSRFVKSVASDAQGRFTIEGLLPGKYLACAVEFLEDETWNDPVVLQRLRAMAVPLDLSAGAKRTVTLKTKGLS
jgi:protocatechuate 3,4-dioxygenase beta subunit